ncbi:hypothetical protein BD560DRAFT_395844 [Blakeslea trispora]|nr:hypothetical protein BD560DRAFT_395844 [Blakeslea trispora]
MATAMTASTLDTTKFQPIPNKMMAEKPLELPGAPVVPDEDSSEKKKKKEKKDKKEKEKEKKKEKKDKKDKKDKQKDKAKEKKKKEESAEQDKPIRQAVGVIVIDQSTQKILLLESLKRPGAYVLPRDDCLPDEHPEKAAIRLLAEKAGIQTTFLSCRVGSYSETNKKGRITDQHWMYEVHSYNLLESDRQKWFTYEDALGALKEKKISHLALEKCSLAAKTV